MSSCTYTTPPLQPELNPSSPFFPTLLSLVVQTQASGIGRDMIHNWMPRRTIGIYGQNFGPDAQIVPSGFPMNAAADGSSSGDYSIRGSWNTRTLRWPYGATAKASAGLQFTYFGVVKFDNICFDQYAPIFGTTLGDLSQHGEQTSGPYVDLENPPDCICAVNYNFGPTTTLGFLGGPQSTGGVIYQSGCVFTPGHWYAVALAGNDANITGSGGVNIRQFRRFYMHDLTTNTRISTTGSGVNQIINLGGSTFSNATQPSWAFNYAATNGDLVLFPGKTELTYDLTHFTGHVKLFGIDNSCWDDSGIAFTYPSGFSVNPFDMFCGYDASGNPVAGGGIYSMIAGTGSYVKGATSPTLICPANAGPIGNPLGYWYLNLASGTTTAPPPSGCPTGTTWVAFGDCSVTTLTDTYCEVSVSRVQGAPLLPTSYTLYYSTSWGNTTSGMTAYATNSTGVFRFIFPDSRQYFFLVTSTDGSHTYTYPPTQATRQLYPAFRTMWSGHSILTKTGNDPVAKLGYYALAKGFDYMGINTASDGAGEGDFFWPSGDLMIPLVSQLTTEVQSLCQPFDAVVLMMEGNGPVDAPTLLTIQNGLLGATTVAANGNTVNLTKRVIYAACPWNFIGHDVAFIAAGSVNQNVTYPQVINNSTVYYIGSRQMNLSANSLVDIRQGHPDWAMAQVEAISYGEDIFNQIISPPAGASRGRTQGN